MGGEREVFEDQDPKYSRSSSFYCGRPPGMIACSDADAETGACEAGEVEAGSDVEVSSEVEGGSLGSSAAERLDAESAFEISGIKAFEISGIKALALDHSDAAGKLDVEAEQALEGCDAETRFGRVVAL